VVNRVHPSFGAGLGEAAGERARTLEGTELGGLYRNLADYRIVSAREQAHLGGLADAVAPAPVVWVPFLSTDVHDIVGMGGLATYLFSR
jgi:hypothetical protein